MNCIDDCPENALEFTALRQDRKQVIPYPDLSRRKVVFAGALGLVVGLTIAVLALFLGTVFSIGFGLSESEQKQIAIQKMQEASRQAYRASLGAASAYLQAGDGPAAIDALSEADPDGQGPANAMLKDPDGNVILLDQFV